MRELLDVAGLRSTTPAFCAELIRVADRLGVDPSALAAVISFETRGTFSPSLKNPDPRSTATGLIQFTEATAGRLSTTTAELAAMTAVEQLAYVEAYLRAVVGGRRLGGAADLYMAVFAPAAIGRSDDWPIPYSGDAYEMNASLDRDKDGVITKGEAARPVLGLLAAAERRPPIVVDLDAPAPGSVAARTVIAVLLLAGAALALAGGDRS